MYRIRKIVSNEDFEANFYNEDWLEYARAICLSHNVKFSSIRRAGGSDHIAFLVDDSLVLKIYRPFRNCFEREKHALEIFSGKIAITIPEIIVHGNYENYSYLLMTRLAGNLISRQDWLKIEARKQIDFIQRLAIGLRQIHSVKTNVLDDNWAKFVADRAETLLERQIACGVNKQILDVLPSYIGENLSLIPTHSEKVFMHADIHFGNLCVVSNSERLEISGLFDFADSRTGFYEYDFVAIGVLMIQGQAELQREFFRAYGYANHELDEIMRKRLMMMTMIYETADLRRYAMRLNPEAVDFTLDELERGIWCF